ncbi:c-type cytochrome biogenesis protein CcmI [Acidimangrovimonas sediminis]|uniref:c-type cytochrome biogenesis protein CcmI n=1 Tax=Acidimangrovimonas sediminis TaxID=2056283 RepID=UPI001E40F3D9|nr:c-type cytochrome biogenesis protein CcmI [Acidimangrovimonas sediminis]
MDVLSDWGDAGFWLAAGVMIAVVAGLMLLALWRGRRLETPAAAYDLQIYRDQLKEVERDLARGTITEEEARRVRTEVSRRVLEADRALAAGTPPRAAPKAASWAAGIVVVLLLAGSVLLYRDVGVPGMQDDPMAARLAESRKLAMERPSQKAISEQFQQALAAEEKRRAAAGQPPLFPPPDATSLAMIEKLRAVVKAHPDDLTGQKLLVTYEPQLGKFEAAVDAQKQVIRLKGDAATAADYVELAALMYDATNGYISPEAESAINTALKMDPKNGEARYYLGVMMAQIGRPDVGFRIWAALLDDSPAGASWVPQLRAQLPQMAALAGVRYQLPPEKGPPSGGGKGALPGPSAGDVAAAQKMTPAERQEMIRGMVQGLAERLDKDGGSPAEWARLIGAYGVLGETAKRADAIAKARAAYKDKPQALQLIENAAKDAAGQGTAAQGMADQGPADQGTVGQGTGAPGAAPALPGPSAGDIAAAQKMTPAERQKMIAGMVQRLNDKLATEGGTAPEWAQLIGAYGVLGNTERATAIWNEAKTRFADHPDELSIIRAAAKKAGVAS